MTGFGLALLALVLGGFASVLLPVRVRASRSVRPRTVHRLGSCTGTLELASTRRFAVQLDATDQVAGAPVAVDVPVLAAGGVERVDYKIPTTRRGLLRVGPLVLRRRGLAGLAESRTVLGETVEVRVVPRVLPVRGLPPGARRGHVGAEERVERGGTDLVGLREYVPGDDLRRLHWATSARTGTLMVREDADPARPHLAVIIDDVAGGYPDPDAFEDAVEIAASLLASAMTAGHPVRLLSTSGTVDIESPATATPADTDLILAALADLQPTPDAGSLTIPLRDLDVVAVVCGSTADQAPLLLEAGRAAVGVLLTVDPAGTNMSAVGTVLILRGPKAENLLSTWDTLVAR